jgi:hypothetical protein
MIVLLSPSAHGLGDVNVVVRRLNSNVFAGRNDSVVGNLHSGLAARIWLKNRDRSSPASSGFEVFKWGPGFGGPKGHCPLYIFEGLLLGTPRVAVTALAKCESGALCGSIAVGL